MPKLAQILRDQRAVQVDLGDGETLNVTYRPGAVTPAQHDATIDLVERGRGPAALARSLADSLLTWDLTDDNDAPYPLDEAHLRELPSGFLRKIFDAIQSDLGPNQKRSGESAGSF